MRISTIARYSAPTVGITLLVLLPEFAHAASSSFFGPIVSAACNCPGSAPSYGCVLDTIQRTINFGITLGITAATLAFAYAGFTWMTGGSSPEARSKGRDMILNVFIGLVILLSAWLIVDYVMKTLYSGDNGSKEFGPWNSILAAKPGDQCIQPTKPKVIGGILGKAIVTEVGGTGPQLAPVPATSKTGGHFTWDPGVQAQMSLASPKLVALLNCMEPKMPAGVGRIGAITEQAIANHSVTIQQCAAHGCVHRAGSCHYGGKTCVGTSYAVDFGDQEHASIIEPIARSCGADYTQLESTNFHISVGKACGCN